MGMITLRSDEELDRLLTELARPGETRSDTIRRAVRDAITLARRERMRQESLACATDERDVTEAAAVQADLEHLRAW